MIFRNLTHDQQKIVRALMYRYKQNYNDITLEDINSYTFDKYNKLVKKGKVSTVKDNKPPLTKLDNNLKQAYYRLREKNTNLSYAHLTMADLKKENKEFKEHKLSQYKLDPRIKKKPDKKKDLDKARRLAFYRLYKRGYETGNYVHYEDVSLAELDAEVLAERDRIKSKNIPYEDNK